MYALIAPVVWVFRSIINAIVVCILMRHSWSMMLT